MSEINPIIDISWKAALAKEFKQPYFKLLKEFLLEEKKTYKVFPPCKNIFNAFNTTPFDRVKIVLLGQDPYHEVGQAHGLCFSVNEGAILPPSLKNIFKELSSDLGIKIPICGDLTSWAKQGVLLLNTVLTVRKGQPESHKNKGWEIFTDSIIKTISNEKSNIVFMLWGNNAREKKKIIDNTKHFVLESAHPSPLSATRGFFGCKHFSKANDYFLKNNIEPINWRL